MAKTLYVFAGSVWAAVAELAVAELGYKEDDVTFKTVNLVEGENFAPSFLKINPNGTLPTLESNGQVYKSTAEVTAVLVKDAPTKVKAGSTIIQTIHEEKYDPNFAMLLARNDAELTAKSAGLAGMFLSKRQEALEKLSADPEAEAFKAFYETKKGQNGGLLAIVTGKAPEEHKAGFFDKSQAHFDSVKTAVFEVIPGFLPDSGFIGGEAPGEDDFHVGAWLTRIAATTGAKSADDALAAMEKAYGAPVPAKVAAYWGAWTARPSWKKVYAGGLH
ncbi:GST N-terminal domain-containing protein [Mycena venus]|uniref:GST N-terminal domain-containing protein n=1 Tax=Mycena venus TaxID=2733690 RepID=A0A8H6XG40_9AGAR|nr:GST N-terminal domain-containing protein [Mycena venus]